LCTRINLGISASIGFIENKFITMHGHKNVIFFNLSFCLIILLVLGLLCNVWSILLLEFALLRCVDLLGLQIMLWGLQYSLLFRIVLVWWVRIVFPEILICLLVLWIKLQLIKIGQLIYTVYLGLILGLLMQIVIIILFESVLV
jgi:hypothetical protein